MEALRKQLGEAEGHLQDRDKKYRELNANFKASTREWADRVTELEAKVKDLEGQNQQLRNKLATAETQLSNGTLITPENRRHMEEKYQKVKDRLADSEKKYERLKLQLLQQQQQQQQSPADGEKSTPEKASPQLSPPSALASSFGSNPASPPRDTSLIVTSGHAMARYNALREAIRQLSIKYFNEPRDLAASAVPEQHSSVLGKLTPSWKAFLSDGGYTSYLFRALIWRYLDEYLFKKPASIWGADIGEAMLLIASKVTDRSEAKEWRQRTVNLLHTTSRFDTSVLENLAQTIIGATGWYISKDEERTPLAKGIAEVVMLGAQLSSIICRSSFAVMMSIYPGSDMIHGFEPAHKTMEVRHQLRGKNVVDLMVTPCLISGGSDQGYTVLEKAEVMC